MNYNGATGIDEVAAASLGVEGWALYDVGSIEYPRATSSTSSSPSTSSTGAAPPGRTRPPTSEILLHGTTLDDGAMPGVGVSVAGASHARGHGRCLDTSMSSEGGGFLCPVPQSRGGARANLQDEIAFYQHIDDEAVPTLDRPVWDLENELSDLEL